MARVTSTLVESLRGIDPGFILVELKEGEMLPVYDQAGQLLKFLTGQEAGSAAVRLAKERGIKIQPRKVSDANWQKREEERLKDGSYMTLPWSQEAWWGELAHIHKEHYPHVSRDKRSLIAFTEDENKGAADIQTPIKPGRYLERYFSSFLNKFVIRDLCCIYAAKFEDNDLQFAETEEDIEEVYLNGPTSCMTKETSAYKTGNIHPVRMYAAGDIKVAYVRRQGRIVARCVTYPEKKVYNAIYGDRARLEPLLQKLGYKSGVPFGARLLRHKIPATDGKHQFVCPHVDGSGLVIDNGKYLIVASPHDAKQSEEGIQIPGGAGATEVVGHKCSACTSESLTQRNIVSAYGATERSTHIFCKKCATEHTVRCGPSGYTVLKKEATPVGKYWCWNKLTSTHTFICSGTGEREFTNSICVGANGEKWSKTYAHKNCRCCARCGFWVLNTQTDCPKCIKRR